MAVTQGQYTKANPDIHLRDYRHAKNLFYEYGLAFAPKTKFLYHCLFEPSPEVGNSANTNAFAFQKHIGVLVKNATLPGFRVQVDNKKQYNRIKQFQTRLDYSDVNITFHDDNLGVTRAMFEEYYKYTWLDGRHSVQKNALTSGPYASRDKYADTVPKYGLNTGNIGPFFSSITIYQLARTQFFAYTLVNPIITQWDHGNVASDENSINENSMSVAYEAVLYTNGDIGDDSQPVAFADPQTGYDQHESPIQDGPDTLSIGPKLLLPPAATESALPRNESTYDEAGVNIPYRQTSTYDEAGTSTVVPRRDNQNQSTPSTPPRETDYPTQDGQTISRALSKPGSSVGSGLSKVERIQARTSFAASAINSGALEGYDNYNDFKANTTPAEREAAIDSLVDRAASGDAKLANQASATIGKFKD